MPALLPSELPVRARTRHHWIVLLRPPHKLLVLALALLLVTAAVQPQPMAWFLLLIVAALAVLRWQTWRAETIVLTGKRIIRTQGIPETTTTETSLRIDRVSGARLVQTVPGKILRYGTIELEAPGDHPGVRRLHRIAAPQTFYLELRRVIFGEPLAPDPDEEPLDYVTEPLPRLEPGRHFGRRYR